MAENLGENAAKAGRSRVYQAATLKQRHGEKAKTSREGNETTIARRRNDRAQQRNGGISKRHGVASGISESVAAWRSENK